MPECAQLPTAVKEQSPLRMIHTGLRPFEPLTGDLNLLVRVVNGILLRQTHYRVELRIPIPTGQCAGNGCRVGSKATEVPAFQCRV
jgi:hypothetical protein